MGHPGGLGCVIPGAGCVEGGHLGDWKFYPRYRVWGGGVTQETVDVPQGRFWEGFNTKTIDMLPQV